MNKVILGIVVCLFLAMSHCESEYDLAVAKLDSIPLETVDAIKEDLKKSGSSCDAKAIIEAYESNKARYGL